MWQACSRLSAILVIAAGLAACDPSAEEPPVGAPTEPIYDFERGERVFKAICLACHGDPRHSAPAIGDTANWEARLQQTPKTLVEHALRGHGDMPAKGGRADVPDEDVAAAVAYVMDRSRRIIRSQRNRERLAVCDEFLDPEACPDSVVGDLLTLQMLYLLNRYSEAQ